jgi:hypothetical protein
MLQGPISCRLTCERDRIYDHKGAVLTFGARAGLLRRGAV